MVLHKLKLRNKALLRAVEGAAEWLKFGGLGASPLRQLSLRPVATGAVVEVTKRLKPLVERIVLAIPRMCGP